LFPLGSKTSVTTTEICCDFSCKNWCSCWRGS
jgi:hypothetical protein